MKSLLEHENRARAVYFDDEGVITSISGRAEEDGKFVWFKFEDVLPFLDGEYKFSDYVVSRTSDPRIYEIVKKKVDIKRREIGTQLHKIESVATAEILIECAGDSIHFTVSDDIRESLGDVSAEQEVKIAGSTSHPFFITIKDKPEFLLDTLLVNFTDLVRTGGTTIDIGVNTRNISIYTKKYFETYSMRRD